MIFEFSAALLNACTIRPTPTTIVTIDATATYKVPARAITARTFFFSSRRRHTSLHGDWSSDVCSSDLGARGSVPAGGPDPRAPAVAPLLHAAERLDRKSVVLGKRVDLGGRRIIKKK